MARKENLLRSSIYQNGKIHDSAVLKDMPLAENKEMLHGMGVVDPEELPSVNCQCRSSSPSTDQVDKNVASGARKRNQTKSNKREFKEKTKTDAVSSSTPSPFIMNDLTENVACATEFNEAKDGNGDQTRGGDKSESRSKFGLGSAVEKLMGSLGLSDTMAGRNLKTSARVALDKASRWFQRQKIWVSMLTTIFSKARNYIIQKSMYTYPILLRWFQHIRKFILLVSLVWLDCTLRGVDSLFRLGTASFFVILWCSILAFSSMIGITNLLIVLVISGLTTYFLGLTLAIVVIATFASAFLWFYGSFWITGLFMVFGGVTFSLKLERLALLVTTIYAIFCAKFYVGWSGLLLGINLAFISSDILIYFIKKNVKENKENKEPDERTRGDAGCFSGQPTHAAFSDESFRTAFGVSPDQSQGVASTSGEAEVELTSEAEVERLLNCVDHYSVLGLSRYQSIDISSLKREYKKKAMLVHPDKNLGNEKAVEAFKKLQNAYEVLLDSIKRKAYDDELRREELFNCFRRFQTVYQKEGRHGFFPSGFSHSEAKEDDTLREVRRIECKKCNKFHIWAQTSRSKAQARWCQDCKEFHNAKDGDGWVEQCGHPFLFGMLQKVDPPHAYVCAESKIYDATDWFLCQGMRCPVNTHKSSFHVNTSAATKHNMRGGSSANRTAAMPPNMDEAMTEEAFFEWLQNAMQSGIFDSNATSGSSYSKSSNGPKSSGSKKKKRGKKQW